MAKTGGPAAHDECRCASRPIRLKLLMAAAAFVFALVAVEAALHACRIPPSPWRVPPAATTNAYSTHPFIISGRPCLFTHIPHCVYTQLLGEAVVEYSVNSRGFRGPELTDSPPEGKRRLLIVGDSMVEAAGVRHEEGLGMLLDADMKPLGWEVLPVGVQGGCPAYYAANFPRYAALHPDAIALVLFDNDVGDDYGQVAAYAASPLLPDCADILVAGRSAPRHRVCLLHMASRMWRRPVQWEGEAEFADLCHSIQATNALFRAGYAFQERYTPGPADWPHAWSMTSAFLDLFHRQAKARGIPLLLVRLSMEHTMPSSSETRRQHAARLNEFAGAWASEHSVPTLVVYAQLPTELDSEGRPTVIFRNDSHPNQLGHKRIAEVLAGWLPSHLPTAAKPPSSG